MGGMLEKWPIFVALTLLFVGLWALAVWSFFLWKRSSGMKRAMYLIGAVVMLLFALAWTIVLVIINLYRR